MTEETILIRDALVVSNSAEHPPAFTGWVTIEGDRISALGEGLPEGPSPARTIEW